MGAAPRNTGIGVKVLKGRNTLASNFTFRRH